MLNDNVRTGTRSVPARSCFGASALIAFLLGAAECQGGSSAIASPPAADSAPRAQPFVQRTGEDSRSRALAEALLSGNGELTSEQRRLLDPFLACGESSAGAAICEVWSEVDAAWNARDAERFSQLFAEDVTFRFVQRGQSLDGRRTLLEHFGERFPRFAPDLRHLSQIRTIHPLAPGVFTADGKVEILRVSQAGEDAHTVLRTFAIFAVMSRKDEDWSIRALRIYQLSPPADNAD